MISTDVDSRLRMILSIIPSSTNIEEFYEKITNRIGEERGILNPYHKHSGEFNYIEWLESEMLDLSDSPWISSLPVAQNITKQNLLYAEHDDYFNGFVLVLSPDAGIAFSVSSLIVNEFHGKELSFKLTPDQFFSNFKYRLDHYSRNLNMPLPKMSYLGMSIRTIYHKMAIQSDLPLNELADFSGLINSKINNNEKSYVEGILLRINNLPVSVFFNGLVVIYPTYPNVDKILQIARIIFRLFVVL